MARPKKQIDKVQVRTLAGFGLTAAEIGTALGCSADTLERRFAASLKEGRDDLNAGLKRKQVEMALDGNTTMLVWLGKQYLGQRDKSDVQQDGDQTLRIQVEYTDEAAND